MKNVVYAALCVASVLALPGCWCSCSKEEQTAQPVKQEAPVTTEAPVTAEQAAPVATPAPVEQVPAK